MKNQPGHTIAPLQRLALTLLIWGWAAPALAVQTHGGGEGLVAHQIGHLLFVIGMASLLFHLGRMGVAGPGWGCFRGFLGTIVAWNILTMTGHWLDERIDPDRFLTVGGQIDAFTVTGFTEACFYLTRLDHLLLVPSFVLLMLALRRWSQSR
jgi:hypothetical protein